MPRESLVDAVAQRILSGIVSGEFTVGEALPPENQLANLCGASRLTVREAVRTLASQQLLAPAHGRGTFVRPVSEWLSIDALMLVEGKGAVLAMLQLFAVREFIEVGAAGAFAPLADEKQIACLEDHLRDMEDAHAAGDITAMMEADLAFHNVILEGTGNAFVAAVLQPIMRPLIEARKATSSVPEMREHAITEHRKILAAVRTAKSSAARAAMRSHMRQTIRDAERFFGAGAQ